MAGPSNETEVEAMERRKVEALEAIAKHLEILASVVEPARAAWTDPEGWGNPVSARDAYLRTSG
jgi:hypothetical protein